MKVKKSGTFVRKMTNLSGITWSSKLIILHTGFPVAYTNFLIRFSNKERLVILD